MIEPNALYEMYGSRGREPGQDEQDWLRAERDEQNWLRAEQDQQDCSEPSRRSLHSSSDRGVHLHHCPRAYRSAGGVPMDCLKCKNLEEAFESRLSKYIEARSAAYYRVSTELAAKRNVDMENARYDLEEHRLVCASALRVKRLNQWLPDSGAIMNSCLEALPALS